MADAGISFAEYVTSTAPRGLLAECEGRLLDNAGDRMPVELDLSDPASLSSLRAIDCGWSQVPREQRLHWLQSLRITLPIRPMSTGDIALLPGGIVVARHPEATLVCDPLQAVTLRDADARQVRRAVGTRIGTATLIHGEEGVVLRSWLPELLPPQCASIVHDASGLPGQAACAGPALIQWFATGATVWPLVPAPPSLSLAASIAAIPLAQDAPPVTAEYWDAGDSDTRLHLLSTGLVDYLGDLLSGDLSDDLRFALADLCVTGMDSLAARLSETLAAIPACFFGDPKACPGEPPAAWRRATALLRRARRPLALLGVETRNEPRLAVAALRDALQGTSALIFHETHDGQGGVTAALDSDAAMFVARWAGEGGRIGVLLEARMAPLELYTLAAALVHEVGGSVVAAAPCWGFCHRIAPGGREAGNATWFGMGVGLDELDTLTSSTWPVRCRPSRGLCC